MTSLFTCLQCFGQCKTRAHRTRATPELRRQEMPDFLASNLWPPNAIHLKPVDYEIWAVMQCRVYHWQIHSVDELKRLLTDVYAVLNSRFLMRLLTDGKRVFMIKEDTSSTACELIMLILSISVTFSVTWLTDASLITKSCQQCWPIHSCSF